MENNKSYKIEPNLPNEANPIIDKLKGGFEKCKYDPKDSLSLIDQILNSKKINKFPEHKKITIMLFLKVIKDLLKQGWGFKFNNNLEAYPPDFINSTKSEQREVKKRIRTSLVMARNDQLKQESVKKFIKKMERPHWHKGRQISITDLFVSPENFKQDLNKRLNLSEEIRDEMIGDSIKPYLQKVTNEKDKHTGFRLRDIWRYSRYTWSLPLKNQPGRRTSYLVRDASREYHPIIGIGALGNSVVQISVRDEDIGWKLDSFLSLDVEDSKKINSLKEEIDHAIDNIYWKDLIDKEDFLHPDEKTLKKLTKTKNKFKKAKKHINEDIDDEIMKYTLSPLYKKKRAKQLYKLLKAKKYFQFINNNKINNKSIIEYMKEEKEGRKSIKTVLKNVKKRHIGSSIMEITTCGALPPYSDIIGGKLVGLLMASPQIIKEYKNKYLNSPSRIASRMKGKEVSRPADLVYLGTTSLYYVGSSQYNRLRAPVKKGELRYSELGKTKGFGNIHLSEDTYKTMKLLLEKHPDLESEDATFAAGVNYKMRTISNALGHLKMRKLQKHKNPRLVYKIPLAKNYKRYLTGLDDKPNYLYDDVENPKNETQKLIDFWKKRWFVPRVKREVTFKRLRNREGVIKVSDFINEESDVISSNPVSKQKNKEKQNNNTNSSVIDEDSKLSWKVLKELKDHRASFAEKLTDEELEKLHVELKLDKGLLDLIKEGKRVYLTGNPGDGKSHIIRKYKDELDELNAYTHLDASAIEEDKLIKELTNAINNNRPSLITINEGPLRQIKKKLPNSEKEDIEMQLKEPFVYDEEKKEYNSILIDLGKRQLLSREIAEKFLDLVLHKFNYDNAPTNVVNNHDMLSKDRVKNRLLDFLDLIAKSGVHITIHQILGFFSYIIIGKKNKKNYYNLIYDENSPLYKWAKTLDPSDISHPLIDKYLWDGHIDNIQYEWLETPDVLTEITNGEEDIDIEIFNSLKRKFYFETKEGNVLLEFISKDRKNFYQVLEDSKIARDTAKNKIIKSLSNFFIGFNDSIDGERLNIWTSLKYDAVITDPASVFLSGDRIENKNLKLKIPKLNYYSNKLIEYKPDHVKLEVNLSEHEEVSLNINLNLWLSLMKLQRGQPQKYNDPLVARRLKQFMSKIASIQNNTTIGYKKIWVRDLERNRTHRIEISKEEGKYIL